MRPPSNYGSNLARLQQIKAHIDPQRVFGQAQGLVRAGPGCAAFRAVEPARPGPPAHSGCCGQHPRP
ncbi:BBE domain-containing protein [Paucibacter sp. XJ19-41]|uniref:BBE domain-containing protein n=1 Tax=Paucibacter sp. XJ19-41 TaxID=2927824 RepID=UPI003FA72835